MTNLRPLLLMIFLLSVVLTEEEQELKQSKTYRTPEEETRLLQRNRYKAIKIYQTNFRSYNFKLNKTSQFLLKPQHDQVIKGALEIYWDEQGVYNQAQVKNGEEVTVQVQAIKGDSLVRQVFFTASGFTFDASAGVTYRLLARQNGTQNKIVIMQLSEALVPEKSAKRDTLQKVEERLGVAQRKLKNALQVASLSTILQQHVNKKIYRQSASYSNYEVLEAFFIVLLSCFEVRLVTSLLKNDNIVV